MIQWTCKLNNGSSDVTFYDSTHPNNSSGDPQYEGKDSLLSGVIKKEVNTAGSFVFEIHKSNSKYSSFKLLKTKVLCYGYDTVNKQCVGNFLGRVSSIEMGFEGVVKITCEGAMATLNDRRDEMRQRFSLEEGANYINSSGIVVATYNLTYSLVDGLIRKAEVPLGSGTTIVKKWCGALRQNNLNSGQFTFEVDNYSVSGWESADIDSETWSAYSIICPTDYSEAYYRNFDNSATLLDSLNSYMDDHGGNLVFEPESVNSTTSKIRIIWVPDYKTPPVALQEKQALNFGTNILSITKTIDTNDIFTRLYPFGKEDYYYLNTPESGDDYYSKFDPSGLDFENDYTSFNLPYIADGDSSVNYIDVSADAISTYGIIEKSVVFDEATTNAKLKKKAQKYINSNFRETYTINVSALDLATIGQTDSDGNPYQYWRVGRYVKITSSYHGISGWFMISAYEQNIFDPSKNKITFNNQPASKAKKDRSKLDALKKTTRDQNKNQTDTTTDLYKRTNANTTDIETKADKSSVPTKTSQLTNDSGFITSDYHDSTKQDVLTAGTGISISGKKISADIKSTSHDSVKINNIVYYESESDYEAITTKDANTLYLIKES